MLKRLSLYTLLLCCVPLFTWLMGWQWQDEIPLTQWDYFLYWLTESGSAPYALITCMVFPLLLFPLFPNKKQWTYAVLVMAGSVVVTQGLKSGLKNVFAEPRPYVSAMVTHNQQSAESFYALTREQRSEVVKDFYQTQEQKPAWIKNHYENEVGYSFPSGHSIFAATWLLLVAGFSFLLQSRSIWAKCLTLLTALWAILMLVSRLRLGMHYPIDLLTSVLLAWLVNMMIFIWLGKKRFLSRKPH